MVFLRGGQVWSVGLSPGEKPEQIIYSKSRLGSLRFSPDGSALALVSNRGTHSFVGVYRFATKSLQYLDPSVDRDSEPAWSRDSKRIAFLRIPANTTAFLFGPVRNGQPWSIRVADAVTGECREVWRAESGTGSVFSGIVGEGQLIWAAGDRIVFPWEKTGWKHLYAVGLAGGKPKALTGGEFEVEHVAVSTDQRNILFSSNQDDIDRRHVWTVSADGSGPARRLTVGSGIEWSPVDAGAGVTAFLASNARQPAHPMIASNGTMRDLVPGLQEIPAAELVEPEPVVFRAADGLPIRGQLFLPKGATGRRPAIVFFHGGSRRQMLLGWHYMAYYSNTYAMNQYLASRGYIVLSVNYRSGTGYGMEFREALNYGATGASEFQDVLGAALYLRSRVDVDPDRVGVYGGSYGGYLTALALARASGLYAAGVDIHGVHDWNHAIRNFVPAYDPVKQGDAARLAFQSSPLFFVESWRSPVLLIHGDDDRNVPFGETVRLAEALRKQGVEFEQLILPDEVHGFLTFESWLRVLRATANYLDRKLSVRAAP
jgi:dipeptidyl aminopeptidase/acylaminoacyl peptidase